MKYLYLFAVPYAISSFYVTRGRDGSYLMCIAIMVFIGFCYDVLFWLMSSSRWTWHAIGHFLTFCSASVFSYSIDAQLEGMAGNMYIMIPVLIIVATGVAVLGNVFLNR